MIQNIPLARILESPTNPRKNFGDLSELVASIRAHGVLSPVLVRPAGESYELVYGHRRLRAAREALLPSIPAEVRELDDREVLEIQIVENSQRADIHPLEEAEALRQLHERYGESVEDLAARIGKSPSFVYSRLRLCAAAPDVREALLAERISPTVALILARMPTAEQQVAALSWLESISGQPTAALARQAIARLMLRLAGAPFDTSDATLMPKAGACSACPKRTGAQRVLFDDVADDLCLDDACYRAKADAAWERRAAQARRDGLRVLKSSEAAQIWDFDGGVASHWYTGFVNLDAKVPALDGGDGKQTWRERLGNPQPILARNPETNRVYELGLAPERATAVESVDPEEAARWEAERQAREAARKTRERLARAVADLGRPELARDIATALMIGHTSVLLVLAHGELLDSSGDEDDVKPLGEALGLETRERFGHEAYDPDEILARIGELDTELLADFVARRAVERAWGYVLDPDKPLITPAIALALEGFGLDPKKLERKAKKHLAREAHASATQGAR